MAYVSSVNYTSEEQFLEAVERAKAARSTRDIAHEEAAKNGTYVSFQTILEQSAGATDAAQVSGTPTASTFESAGTVVSDTDLDAYFQKAADTYGISADLIKAVAKQESNFLPNVVSSSGAVGVMQLMPATAAYLGVSNPYDAEQNIMGGAKLLSQISERYNGNLDLTLAAYNAGAGSVDSYGGIPPYAETQNFLCIGRKSYEKTFPIYSLYKKKQCFWQ